MKSLLVFLSLFLCYGSASAQSFARGADISWYTEMEASGRKFYDSEGKELSCPTLMKQLGMNSVRFRVWVDPKQKSCSFCDKEDVVLKAKAAKALGMQIMIDFHYSDWWTEPGRQDIPAAWKEHNLPEMCEDIARHTTDVLTALRNEGVTPRWIQIGNETNGGMLWETGRASDGNSNYSLLFKAGANAAKQIFPQAIIVAHIAKSYDSGSIKWNLDLLKKGGAAFDAIGVSCYPSDYRYWSAGTYANETFWSEVRQSQITLTSAADYLTHTFESIDYLHTRYGVPVIICETGMPSNDITTSAEVIASLMQQARQNKHCTGVFYWEPEVDGKWRPSSYQDWGWNAYDKGAFKNNKPTEMLSAFAPTAEEQTEESSAISRQNATNLQATATSYDLSGRKSSSTSRGIILHNRKKYLVR